MIQDKSHERAFEQVSLMRRQPNLTVEEYMAAVQAMDEKTLQAEFASARRQLSPARWNALTPSMQQNLSAKFDVLRTLMPQ